MCASWNRNARDVVVALGPERVQGHRHQVVLAHGEHQVHSLAFLEMLRKLPPHRFGNELLAVQIVGGPQQRRIGRTPARRVGAKLDPRDLIIGEAGAFADRHMLGPFIAGAAQEAGAEDNDLTLA